MSTTKKLILLAVVVAVLFGISLALAYRYQNKKIDPAGSWLKSLDFSARLRPEDVAPTAGWSTGNWTVPKGVGEAKLQILESKSPFLPRKVKVTLVGSGPFKLTFTPAPDSKNSSGYADEGAMLVTTNLYASVEFTVLKHGGALAVQRNSSVGDALIKLE